MYNTLQGQKKNIFLYYYFRIISVNFLHHHVVYDSNEMKYPHTLSYTYAQFLPGAKKRIFSPIIVPIVTDNSGIGKESVVTGVFSTVGKRETFGFTHSSFFAT